MLQCERVEVCTSRADVMIAIRGSAHAFQAMYCAGNHFACARYKAYECLHEDDVPTDLRPHDHGRLKALIPL